LGLLHKISFWSQFERGILSEYAVQVLVGLAETMADKPRYLIHTSDLKKYWSIRGFFPWIRSRLKNSSADVIPPIPEWRLSQNLKAIL